MRRAALLSAAALTSVAVFSTAASAQLVPLARCHAALPCSIPYGLRPSDAVSNNPDAGIGNSLIGIALDGGLKPRLAVAPISEDPVESAARMYVHRNPIRKSPTPTPAAKAEPSAAPKP
jgi:hypothetical protein